MESYSVDIVLIITRRGAPNTVDFPSQCAFAAETTPLHAAEAGACAEERRNGGVWR